MALRIQSSFSTGEIDPALQERTTFDKFKAALATGRNAVVGKTGRLISRPGRRNWIQAKLNNKKVTGYLHKEADQFHEIGHLYGRIYTYSTGVLFDNYTHDFTEDDLENLQFVSVQKVYGSLLNFLYIFCDGKDANLVVNNSVNPCTVSTQQDLYIPIPAPSITSSVAGATAPTGYTIDYGVSVYAAGEESVISESKNCSLPILVNETNIITVATGISSNFFAPPEIRIYRRPRNGGAYGFVGSSSRWTLGGAGGVEYIMVFTDVGQSADYSHQPVLLNQTVRNNNFSDPSYLNPKTATIYQQRLIISSFDGLETSRIGLFNNFYRNFPLDSDSSLSIKAGTSQSSKMLRLIESDGLIAFTSEGVYLHSGILSSTNIGMVKKGNWIIEDKVPPLALPGGVLFVDKATNCVRTLAWSNEEAAYSGNELSIFSDHLFTGRKVKSWALQRGQLPVLWITFTDGAYATFTYVKEHEMRAWMRHDSVNQVERVFETKVADETIFAVYNPTTGNRYFEISVPRYASAETKAADTEWYMGNTQAALDSMVSYKTLLNSSLAGADQMVVSVLVDDWDANLRITCGTSGLFPSPGAGAVGSVLRYFAPDGTSVDLTVVTYESNNSVIVKHNVDFPSDQATLNPHIYVTATTYTGLDHMEGETVSIMMDGYVIASPNNDNFDQVVVTGGSITLPNGLRGAIVHIGRPFTNDIETLDIDTVEQRPVLLESQTVNKLYIKTLNSRGLYVGSKFPAEDKVRDMETLEQIEVDYDNPNEEIVNRFQPPVSKRFERTIPGSWKSNGRICIRNVDPVHWEILSIAPDDEDLRR